MQCSAISASLENHEYRLFGKNVNPEVLSKFIAGMDDVFEMTIPDKFLLPSDSYARTHDEVSNMFLYKLVLAEKAGNVPEIEALVQSVVWSSGPDLIGAFTSNEPKALFPTS